MFYLIYKITNNINGKHYIGCHKTSDKNDGYMGSGKLIVRAIKKYGIENFSKEIIVECSNSAEMFSKEKELVILCAESYNLKSGGAGGFDFINGDEILRIAKNKKAREITNSRHHDKLSEWGSKGGRVNIEKHGVNQKWLESGRTSFLGKTHTKETKQSIGNKNSIHQSGDKNSQFGTMWITNGVDVKKVKKTSVIPEGWRKGRK